MTTLMATKTFRHDNNCKMSGCPGHVMRVEHQTTSDSFLVTIDDEIIYGGDDNTTRTLMTLIKAVDYD